MKYLLDTNIVLLYLRGDKRTELIESDYQIFDSSNELYISVVTIAELRSFMIRRNYGAPKIKALQTLLEQFRIIDINIESILNRYAEIDAFSQGALPDKKGSFSARNMGKNDLFIAATSSVFDLPLITTDKDFRHLAPDYIDYQFIDQDYYRKQL